MAVHASTWRKVARTTAWTEQDRRCAYCRSILRRSQVTADHRVPRSRHGLDRPENIDAACADCNQAKGSMSKAEFKRLIHGIVPTHDFKILLCRAAYRLNRRADKAVKRILAMGGVTS